LLREFRSRRAAEKRPIFIADVDHAQVLNPDPAAEGSPLAPRRADPLRDSVIGVLHVGTLQPRQFDRRTRSCSRSSRRIGLGIEYARLYREAQETSA